MEELRRRGYNYDFRKMNRMDWIPVSVRKEFLYAIIEALNWDENKIFYMGVNSPRVSIIIKHFFGLFLSPKRVLQYAPEMWKEQYDVGELVFDYFEDGRASVVIKNFDLDPLFCLYLKGYFTGIMHLTRVKNPHVDEVECTYRGGEYHRYVATWEK